MGKLTGSCWTKNIQTKFTKSAILRKTYGFNGLAESPSDVGFPSFLLNEFAL